MNAHLEILVDEMFKNGVKAKCCSIITDDDGKSYASEPFLDFSEHDRKVSEEKDKRIAELERQIQSLEARELKILQWNVELEEENSKLHDTIDEITNEEYVALESEGYYESQIEDLEDRHQSDCIRINQLLTTIDVLTERYQKLREIHGL